MKLHRKLWESDFCFSLGGKGSGRYYFSRNKEGGELLQTKIRGKSQHVE